MSYLAADHRQRVTQVYLGMRLLFLVASLAFLFLLKAGRVTVPGVPAPDLMTLWKAWFIFLGWSLVLFAVTLTTRSDRGKLLFDALVRASLFPDGYAIFLTAATTGAAESPLYDSVYLLIAIHSYHILPLTLRTTADRFGSRYLLGLGAAPPVLVAMWIYCVLSAEPASALGYWVEFGLQTLTASAFTWLGVTNLRRAEELERKGAELQETAAQLQHTHAHLKKTEDDRNELLRSLQDIANLSQLETEAKLQEKLLGLASGIGKAYSVEYCAIGLCTDTTIEDAAIWTPFTRTTKVEKLLKKVRVSPLDDSLIGTIITEHRQPFFWDTQVDGDLLAPNSPRLASMALRINAPSAALYKEILKSGHIQHMLIIPFYSHDKAPRPVGYIHMINRLSSDGATLIAAFPSEAPKPLGPICSHLAIAIENFRAREKERAQQREEQFFSANTADADPEQVFRDLLAFLNKTFDSRVASLWIPVQDGFGVPEETLQMILRAVVVSGPEREPGANKRLEASLSASPAYRMNECFVGWYLQNEESPFAIRYLDNLSEYPNCWGSFRDQIDSNKLVAVPVEPYPLSATDGRPPWHQLLAVLCLRPRPESFALRHETEERLARFSRHIAIIIEQLGLRRRYEQIERLQESLEKLHTPDLTDFYQRLTELVQDVIDAQACSLFLSARNSGALRLNATTARDFILANDRGEFATHPSSSFLGSDIYPLDDGGITGEAFKRKEAGLVYDAFRHSLAKRRFLEVTPRKQPRSVIVAPLIRGDGKPLGVIRCVNPRQGDRLLHSFLQADRDFLVLLSGIITRFIENAQWHDERQSFLRKLAHEFTTPLSGTEQHISYVRKVVQGHLRVKDRDQHFDYISDNLAFLTYLVRDIQLQFGAFGERRQYDFHQAVDLRPMIEKVKKVLLNEARLNRAIDIRHFVDRLPELHVDRMRFEQVLFNLIQNAIKYSHRGSEDIKIEYNKIRQVVEGRQNSEWHALAVRNWGIGVPAGEEELIFEEYTRGSNASYAPSGTGLGLAVSKRIVENHGGLLQLSHRNWPTVFSILLPTYLERQKPRS